MSKIQNSVRVSHNHWYTEENFQKLLALLTDYRDCIDQVAFFSTTIHSPLPLETAAKYCDILKDRIARTRALGFSAGFNILATIGHHEENLDEALQGDKFGYRYFTDLNGVISRGSYCPADEKYLEEYVRPLYHLHCAANPDFIWVDDDLRCGHLPGSQGCFCDACIAKFNEKHGYNYTRETLKADLDDCKNITVRKQYLQFNSEKLAGVLACVRRAVNEYDDKIMLGVMSGERYFEGYDFKLWADALSDNGKYEIMWRPGGGAYNDYYFGVFTEKAHQIGRQTDRLPACVTEIQSEIECHPQPIYRKAPRSIALESMMYLCTGSTGTALNILSKHGEDISIMRPRFEAVQKATPFMRRLSKTFGRSKTVGIHDGWHIHALAAVPGSLLSGGAERPAVAWGEICSVGLPESYDFNKAVCYALSGRAPYAFTDEEIKTMLSSGVFLDAGAVQSLHDLGYGEYIGFRYGERINFDTREIYSEHPLNAGIVGNERYCSSIFCGSDSMTLIPEEGAEVLCHLVDFKDNVIAPCTMGVYRNKLGGLVCAASHYATHEVGDTLKSLQLRNVFRYISNDRLPCVVETYIRTMSTAREIEGGLAVGLLNPTVETAKDVTILLQGKPSRVVCTNEACEDIVLEPVGTDGNMTKYVIPTLEAYQVVLIVAEN